MATTRGGADTHSESPSSHRIARKRAHQEEPSIVTQSKRKKSSDEEKSLENENNSGEAQAVPLRTKSEIIESSEATIATTTIPSRNHIRFSSTSPPPVVAPAPIAQLAVVPAIETNPEEVSDDDAAPEAISHSAAQAQSRAIEAVARKADLEDKQAKKTKRRKRGKKLKDQAGKSEKRVRKDVQAELEQTHVDSEDEEELAMVEDKDEPASAPAKSYSLDNLPTLLPDELLATEAPLRLHSPPPTTSQIQRNTKTTFNNSTGHLRAPQPKPPQDLILEDKQVRVMTKTNSLLPPKATENSRSIRQSWMKGRLVGGPSGRF
ncbi:hypothetical protein EJ08DRAFT_473874 [Tothia fuscella]|uniref:Uncharacterized protein n=1 Tax=Tothia fuscella TaxID=1048955 RepID=A0A9P4NZT2_9PEZI|nr:hypothetical protein EJ08DRAFT_473874 [Tothia fuscella]